MPPARASCCELGPSSQSRVVRLEKPSHHLASLRPTRPWPTFGVAKTRTKSRIPIPPIWKSPHTPESSFTNSEASSYNPISKSVCRRECRLALIQTPRARACAANELLWPETPLRPDRPTRVRAGPAHGRLLYWPATHRSLPCKIKV